MVGLDTKLRDVLGGRSATTLADALDLETAGDLLRHLPRRYAERGELTDLADLRAGEVVTIQARVEKVTKRPMRNRRTFLTFTVTDGRSTATLTFFNQVWRERELRPGTTAFFSGKIEFFRDKPQIVNPEVQLLGGPDGESAGDELDAFAGSLVPIYPLAGKLTNWQVAKCVRVVLDQLDDLPDPLPTELRRRHRLPGLTESFRLVHLPPDRDAAYRGRKRLTWDEALVVQVTLAQRRLAVERTPATPRVARPDGLLAAFDENIPFTLTAGQRAVGATLTDELARSYPMHRLLQGEVGSGKTVVALRAMLAVVDAGGQAALLAPTEVLAQQHARSLRTLLGPLGRAGELDSADDATRVALVTGSLGAAARRSALAEVADGSAGLVVGTHALLEEAVAFRDLGLVVVDEQHRFGVEQRDALRVRAEHPPHVLVMTATPIPRTVAMTVFGDLETSELRELPAGRPAVSTFAVPPDNPSWDARMWGRVRDEAAAGHQSFVVCPRIGGTGEDTEAPTGGDPEARQTAAVLDVLPLLRDGELAGLRLAALHGRLPPEEKDAVMGRFVRGELDVLVATTVVEVGVDVPNATVMVVLDADRFGVSQLHQLRGRVGRGTAPGWCLLRTEAPADAPAFARLDAVAATRDGFDLSLLDLRQRREGDVLGASQSGRRRSLRLLDLLRDTELIMEARDEAAALVAADPTLAGHPALAGALAAALDEESAAYLEKG